MILQTHKWYVEEMKGLVPISPVPAYWRREEERTTMGVRVSALYLPRLMLIVDSCYANRVLCGRWQ
jgi:hypothetical protein